VRKEKIENIFMVNYGDIIFIIFLELYFAYPLQFNVNHINPAILSNTSSLFSLQQPILLILKSCPNFSLRYPKHPACIDH
jgi:hypothetical protein